MRVTQPSINKSIADNTAALEARINTHLVSILSSVNEVAALANNNKTAIQELRSSCDNHSNKISTLSADTEPCANSIQSLQWEYAEFKSKTWNAIAEAVQTAISNANNISQEDLFGEFLGIQRCSNNLIFFKYQKIIRTIFNLLKLAINVDVNTISVKRCNFKKRVMSFTLCNNYNVEKCIKRFNLNILTLYK